MNTTTTHSSFTRPFRPSSARLLVTACAAAGVLFAAGCRDRDVAEADEKLTAANTEPLSPTRGDTGASPDPETQGGSGMFEAETRPDPNAAGKNEYVSGYGEVKEIPTEKWEGRAFGQEHASRYTTSSDTAAAEDRRGDEAATASASAPLEQRIRTELRDASGTLAVSREELDRIEIAVTEGNVRLSGNVADEAAAERIEERVSQIEGVHLVDNQLVPATASGAAE